VGLPVGGAATRGAPAVLRVLFIKHPALTCWAKVCRASGALQTQRRRAGWKPALRKGIAKGRPAATGSWVCNFPV